ncbi:hypothetical protein IWX81_000460 [Salinibacterium sp. CAN_S4]|uniref:GNAT family N-acetyltransferase n=1 Tax=Salinibacterium sp. CAN_S4 TaxID=2787727 RepID=UPI001A1A49BA
MQQNLRAQLLDAYDSQLRSASETPSAASVELMGPLRLVTFAGGRGFITYRDLGSLTELQVRQLVPTALDHFQRDLSISRVEWKTRAHDAAPGLGQALLDNGFVADDTETIMIGDADALATEVPLPDGITLRTVVTESDVRAMSAMQDEVFGDPVSEEMAVALLNRMARRDGMQLWVAESGGIMVSAGRLEPVPDTQFAGIWGGATRADWRGRGIYKALTAARARAAIVLGKTLIHSDSTEYSRPILERSGLIAVSSTTPYRWRR